MCHAQIAYVYRSYIYKIPLMYCARNCSLDRCGSQDLGEWIGAGSHSLFNFPPGVRPVPLEIHIQGFDIVNFDSRLQAMARPTYAALVAASNEVPPSSGATRVACSGSLRPVTSREGVYV